VRYTGSVSVSSLGDGAVRLDNGETIDCDLVIAATGVKPQSALARAAGIDTSEGRIGSMLYADGTSTDERFMLNASGIRCSRNWD
jgi:NAD(P)H-nitrite reductase large subunit